MSPATKAPRYQVTLHEPLSAEAQEAPIEALVAIDADEFGTAPGEVLVECNVIGEGMWFTAAEPTSSTIVTGTVPVGTSPERRSALVERLGRTVAATTGQDFHDIMVVASDSASQRG